MHSRFDTEARIAVAQATDLASELGHREVGLDHLLLGLLANPRGAAYASLTAHGLRLDTAREIVAAEHVDPVEAADADSEQDSQPTSYDADREALRAIGIDLDRVRAAVQDNLGQDLSDDWGARPGRGRRGGRGRARGEARGGGHHHGHHHRPDGEDDRSERDGRGDRGGRGRRGPRSRRGESPRFSRELRSLLHDVRRSSRRDDSDERSALTGARFLVELTRSENASVRAVLAGATDLDGLRKRAEAAADAPANPAV